MIQTQHRILLGIIGAALAAVGLAACDKSGDVGHQRAAPSTQAATPATSPSYQVVIDNFTFSPRALTVPVGTRVTWVNHDDVPHTVVSVVKPRLFASATLDTDDTYSFVFTAAGTYDYFCGVHAHMTGQVIAK